MEIQNNISFCQTGAAGPLDANSCFPKNGMVTCVVRGGVDELYPSGI